MTSTEPQRVRRPVRTAVAAVGWAVSAVVVAGLAFSYLLPQRLTDTARPYADLAMAAFFGRVFTFHAGLLLGAVAAVGLLVRSRSLAAAAALAAAVALAPTARACLPRHPPPAAGPAVRVMAMNTKYPNHDATDILAQVRRYNPDLLTVEEFAAPARRALDAGLAGDYPYRCLRPGGGIGLALYSRLPFDGEPPRSSFDGTRRQIRAVVRIDGRRVAVYALHPISPRTLPRVLSNRLAIADLVDQLRREPLPVVLAGDFNFTADTPNAAALTGLGLTDAFDLAATGRGSTWPVKPRWAAWLPGVRIDHVYLSHALTATRYRTGGYTGSDHLPIVVDVAVAAP